MDRYRMFAFGSGQGAVGFQRLELKLPLWEGQVTHCKELAVLINQKSLFQSWEPEVTIASNFQFPKVGTDAPQRGTKVTTTRNCQFQDLETYGSQPGNQRLPLQGAACSERLELLVPNLGTMWVTLASNCRLLGDKTHASKPGNHRLPLQELPLPPGWNWRFATWEQKIAPSQGTAGSQA